MSIKFKLIIIFVFIKVIPLLLMTYLGIESVKKLNNYFIKDTESLYLKNEETIKNTAYNSINDSINALDAKSQELIEKITVEVADKVSTFLYERDRDILFLSKLNLNQKIIEDFYKSKEKEIILTPEFIYSDENNKWIRKKKKESYILNQKSEILDNNESFRYINPIKIDKQLIPIYKEISFFNLNGQEIYKKSSIDMQKKDLSKKENTYLKSENFFSKIQDLKEGEIYVSEVIGEYVPSKIIGIFTKEKAKKSSIEFKPESHAFAGIENPVGKKFDGIIRFVTPVFKNDKRVAYISILLDHRHIMEYTDTLNPSSGFDQLDISDASVGNYAFMWDYKGRNISHPRDYFITGFDSKTGERVPGWLSKSLAQEFVESKENDLNKFLEKYPEFHNQSLKEKPNLKQLKEKGEIGLDCRYLNFAPQCKGWMELTQNGGYGSFKIYWSNVWKLTTAATIPYYTGQYKNSKRGFGFVTIGANVDEFHSAANKTKENIENVIKTEIEEMDQSLNTNEIRIDNFIRNLINELSFYTFIMIIFVIFIAFWMSNYISKKIKKLIIGTKEFSKNNLKYRIEVSSKDEIGKLEDSFNKMAERLEEDREKIKKQYELMGQQSKMASMGEMLGNIAHQWRQPLSTISVASTGAKLQKELDCLTDEHLDLTLDSINNSAQYLSQTIDDFRSFLNPDGKVSKFNISGTFIKTLKLINPQFITADIKIIENIEKHELQSIENELIQVLINILNNSRDALLNIDKKQRYIFIDVYRNNNNLVIEIKDNANGIPEKIKNRIFEPYFTTKHKSQGTGIGLYMSSEIVKVHLNGKIFASNVKYTYKDISYFGAKFTITIPIE